MDDPFGIVYHFGNPRQFWDELEDILKLPSAATLSRLDGALHAFISLCTKYHEQYMQTNAQLEHACSLLLDSELFTFHSDRMSDYIISEAQTNTDPHSQLVLHSILLMHGRRHPTFLRSHAKWKGLIPMLMDHILIDVNDPHDLAIVRSNSTESGIGVPIEARLRGLAVGILYEVCRVQKMTASDLRIFDDHFLDHLFELVERTRNMTDETLNYSLIKLIVALNEQFMVASLGPPQSPPPTNGHGPKPPLSPEKEKKVVNRVLRVLMRRLNSSKTFGENLIFMLNRADVSPEDMCMRLLILKILYLLFTTPGTQEYLYTNDLCVLVDVFLREIGDLPEENESLRHTYLRVLHPLITNTQLRTIPYKRPQIRNTLRSLIAHSNIRDISPTTRRLVDRSLSAEWCVALDNKENGQKSPTSFSSASSSSGSLVSAPGTGFATAQSLAPPPPKALQRSVSAEVLKPPHGDKGKSNDRNRSTTHLVTIAAAAPVPTAIPSPPLPSPVRSTASEPTVSKPLPKVAPRPPTKQHTDPPPEVRASLSEEPGSLVKPVTKGIVHHRSAPAPPTKRRKPPAIPTRSTTTTTTTTTIIASSKSPSPLSRVTTLAHT